MHHGAELNVKYMSKFFLQLFHCSIKVGQDRREKGKAVGKRDCLVFGGGREASASMCLGLVSHYC